MDEESILSFSERRTSSENDEDPLSSVRRFVFRYPNKEDEDGTNERRGMLARSRVLSKIVLVGRRSSFT